MRDDVDFSEPPVAVQSDYASTDAGDQGTGYFVFYGLNVSKFADAISAMPRNAVTLDSLDGDHTAASLDGREAGIALFTVIYDRGWSAKTDGRETEIVPLFGDCGLIGVPYEAVSAILGLSFEPPGLKAGIIIGIATLMVVVVAGIALLFIMRGRLHVTIRS